jgi:hypothetical protein
MIAVFCPLFVGAYFCLLVCFLHLLQMSGGVFFLTISNHYPVKFHETLLDAGTLKPAVSI